jgi:hypothetical protein
MGLLTEGIAYNRDRVIPGGNADIDVNGGTSWKQGKCPWTKEDGKEHKCAVKNVSICDHFVSFGDNKAVDNIHCCYPKTNPV